jgi:hypothetical protein
VDGQKYFGRYRESEGWKIVHRHLRLPDIIVLNQRAAFIDADQTSFSLERICADSDGYLRDELGPARGTVSTFSNS